MKLLFLDFETQSDDPATTNVTEIGAILIETSHSKLDPETALAKEWEKSGGYQELERYSQLVYHADYPPQTEEIVSITGITDQMLQKDGISPPQAFPPLLKMVPKADYILAHNERFDHGVFNAQCRRLGLDSFTPTWICTWQDVPYPKKYRCKRLSHLAYDHGIVKDASTLHRAINDVELLAELILTKYKMADILAYKNIPWAYICAKIPAPWEDNKVGVNQAKKLSFRWQEPSEGMFFEKKWVKRIKETDIEEEKAKCPFPITRLVTEIQGDVP